MANFFSDNKDLQFHLGHPMMRKIVELKERGFAEKDLYDFAPQDFEDAMDSYRRVLEIAGEICGEVIAPNAEGVDHEGPRVVNDHVEYASGTVRNMKAIVDAGLSGMTLPRKYDGLNFPLVCFVMANEMVSRADAGFENIWGLQDCAETLNEFASEEIKAKFLPWVSAGATCAMDLTEPDAGSDLGAVMLKATWSEEKQTWLLNGVKRFITNGDGDVSLVLARTEEGTTDARGLSMLVYDKRDGGVKVRRIENKMGIKGSPTCELVFTNAPAQLVGDRKMGLIKYVMSLMNAARLGIGFTPLVKLFSSEYANQQAYDAIQIHGGSGFMKDYPCERLYRDARIMNIYEGTSQLQVVAAINSVTKGTFMEQIERYAAAEYSQPMQPVVAKLKELTAKFAEMIARVEAGDKELCGFKDFHARRLVETAGHIIITYLLARQAGESEEYVNSAKVFCKLAEGKISEAYTYVMNSTLEDVELFKAVIEETE